MAREAKNTFDIAEAITKDQAIAGTNYTTNSFTINVERVAAKVTMTCENPVLTDKMVVKVAEQISIWRSNF